MGVDQLKLCGRKAKLTRGFSNPCYYERLGEQFVLSTNLVEKRLCSCYSDGKQLEAGKAQVYNMAILGCIYCLGYFYEIYEKTYAYIFDA